MHSSSIVEECLSNHLNDNATDRELFQCALAQLESREESRSLSFLAVFSSAMVFFMQAGFAMLVAGSVRTKNVGNSMLKNLLDACGGAIAFYCVGYAIAFGDGQGASKTFIGTSNFFLRDVDGSFTVWLFHFAFSAASATIVAGTLAERCQMVAYLCYSVLLVGWVYPVIVHSIWSDQGFLSPTVEEDPFLGVGVIDFAGSGVVHLTGGITALFAAKILGPRRGRFYDEQGRPLDTPEEIQGSSIALQMLGCFVLWFGWYGFNVGSALLLDSPEKGDIASLVGVNTTLAAGSGCLASLFLNLLVLERLTGESFFDLRFAMNGTLSGLVAITGACGVVEPWAAIIIGVVSGMIYILGTNLLIRCRIDDAVDGIPIHMFNGIWGMLCPGLFASQHRLDMVYHGREFAHVGWVYNGGDLTLLAAQVVGILFICGWVFCFMFPFFIWLDWKGWFRSDPLEEIVGLDCSYHGGIVMMTESQGVRPEYIDAFNKRREDKLGLGEDGLRSQRSIVTHNTEPANHFEDESARNP